VFTSNTGLEVGQAEQLVVLASTYGVEEGQFVTLLAVIILNKFK
jgi:hypothetical protein